MARFEKGHIPWIKGKKQSESVKLKVSLANKGRKRSEESKNKQREWALKSGFGKINKGCKLSEEHKQKIRLAHVGKNFSEEHKKKMSFVRKGKHYSANTEFKKGMTAWNKGKKIPEKTRFKMLGRTFSEEHKHKLSLAKTGGHLSEETKKKLSNTNKGRLPFMAGKKHSEESRNKMSESQKGRHHSENTKIKIGLSNKGKTIGRKHTEEHKRKIGLAGLGRHHSKETKRKMSNAVKAQYRNGRELKKSLYNTSIEIKIQNLLRELEIDFKVCKHMNIEHAYFCDIFIPEFNCVIECDGDYWHNYPVGNSIDHIRTKELMDKGFKVLRLWEKDIKTMTKGQFRKILKTSIARDY